jgi:hypothetical protein
MGDLGELDRTRDLALDTIAPALNALGYELRRQSPITLGFERSRVRANETSMIIHGRAPRKVRNAFAQLRFT